MKKKHEQGEFLQSKAWMDFQEAFGRGTFEVTSNDFSASLVEHELPLVGKYLYAPRGPIVSTGAEEFSVPKGHITSGMRKVIELAKKEHAGWIRIEPATEALLGILKGAIEEKIVKAPYDVQPREIFAIDIAKNESVLLAEMKSKVRYNIGLAKKKGVVIKKISRLPLQVSNEIENTNSNYVDDFLKLTNEMALRQGIIAHPQSYYRKMMATLPPDVLTLYTAEYEGKIIAANLMVFYGETATYLHGASSNEHRNVMAPLLLQWQAILDAKERGCMVYDFGGVKKLVNHVPGVNTWEGITNFKLGFSPNTQSTVFPGTYDIIINPRAYGLYRGIQNAKHFLKRIRK